MERRDIVIGIVILAVVAAAIFLLRRNPSVPQLSNNNPLATPSAEDRLEDAFKTDIPDDVEKAELRDVANVNATALATRKWENNRFEVTVMADLPDLEEGFYQAWMKKDTNYISLGTMRMAKGGWIIEYQSNTNYSDYENVVVTQETTNDAKPEKHIVEGSF